MKKLTWIFVFILLLASPFSAPFVQGQTTDLSINRPNFTPLLADPKETRVGALPYLSKKSLMLDIGTSLDLVHITYPDSARIIGVGADFGTYSLLRRSNNFKFPVDAIDYIFGLNISYRQPVGEIFSSPAHASARLRISHISAHFVDGHYQNGDWITEGTPFAIPFVYSKEFINLVTALSVDFGRAYLGYEYTFHTLPKNISPHSYQAGLELYMPNFPVRGIWPFIAVDFKLLPIWQPSQNESDGYAGTLNLQLGAKTNAIGERGVRVVFNYFNGMDRHGMYFYRRVSFSTVGFLIDF
jgi:hypothetical protein